jgi:hypothetical protein
VPGPGEILVEIRSEPPNRRTAEPPNRNGLIASISPALFVPLYLNIVDDMGFSAVGASVETLH